jgi:hypothetical protein
MFPYVHIDADGGEKVSLFVKGFVKSYVRIFKVLSRPVKSSNWHRLQCCFKSWQSARQEFSCTL